MAKQHTVSIQGMHCQHCMMKVNQSLATLPSVSNIQVDLMEEHATFDAENAVDAKLVEQKIQAAGFTFLGLK
jgi:copper chaperone